MFPSFGRVLTGALFILLLIVSACIGKTAREGVTPMQTHMYSHLDRAGELHDALVRGDLDRARSPATWIATHQERRDFTGKSAYFQDAMRAFAAEVGKADHLQDAAYAAGRMGQTCGDCHRENEVEPRFLIGTAPPPSGSGAKAEMARHVWASERMWEGLVGPGDQGWSSGVEALVGGWLDTQDVVSNPQDQARIRELVRQIYDLGGKARSAASSSERAELYGEFLNTCNECHLLTEAQIR